MASVSLLSNVCGWFVATTAQTIQTFVYNVKTAACVDKSHLPFAKATFAKQGSTCTSTLYLFVEVVTVISELVDLCQQLLHLHHTARDFWAHGHAEEGPLAPHGVGPQPWQECKLMLATFWVCQVQ